MVSRTPVPGRPRGVFAAGVLVVLLAGVCGVDACAVDDLVLPPGATLRGAGCGAGETAAPGGVCEVLRPGYRCSSFECRDNSRWGRMTATCRPNKCAGGPDPEGKLDGWDLRAAALNCNPLQSGMQCDNYCLPGYTARRFELVCVGPAAEGVILTQTALCKPFACTASTGAAPPGTVLAGGSPFESCVGRSSGDLCTGYRCTPPQLPTPASFPLTCSAEGRFSVQNAYRCEINPRSCVLGPTLGSVPAGLTVDAFAACNARLSGDECSDIRCPAGEVPRGPLLLDCVDGSYSAAGVACVSRQLACSAGPRLTALPEGINPDSLTSCNDLYSGDTCAAVACKSGFRRTGSLIMVCQAGQPYTVSGVTCAPQTCGGGAIPGTVPQNVDTASLAGCSALASGEVCAGVRCNEGYQLSGTLTMACDASGRYSGAGIRCRDVGSGCDPADAPGIPFAAVDCADAVAEGAFCRITPTTTGNTTARAVGSVVCNGGGYASDVRISPVTCPDPMTAPPVPNGVSRGCTGGASGMDCTYVGAPGFTCEGVVACTGGMYSYQTTCAPVRCGVDEFVAGGVCRACELGEASNARPLAGGGDTTCTPAGAWQLLVRTRAGFLLYAQQFDAGYGDVNGGGDAAYAIACNDLPASVTTLRVVAGGAVDYVRPSSSGTVCGVLRGDDPAVYSKSQAGAFVDWTAHRASRAYDRRPGPNTWLIDAGNANARALGGGCCNDAYAGTGVAVSGYGKTVAVYGLVAADATGGGMGRTIRVEYSGAATEDAVRPVVAAVASAVRGFNREARLLEVLSVCPGSACLGGVCPVTASERLRRDCLVKDTSQPVAVRVGSTTHRSARVLQGSDGRSYADMTLVASRTQAEASDADATVQQRAVAQLQGSLGASPSTLSDAGVTAIDDVAPYTNDVPPSAAGAGEDDGFPTWAVVLLVILLLLSCAFCVFLFCLRKKQQAEAAEEAEAEGSEPGGENNDQEDEGTKLEAEAGGADGSGAEAAAAAAGSRAEEGGSRRSSGAVGTTVNGKDSRRGSNNDHGKAAPGKVEDNDADAAGDSDIEVAVEGTAGRPSLVVATSASGGIVLRDSPHQASASPQRGDGAGPASRKPSVPNTATGSKRRTSQPWQPPTVMRESQWNTSNPIDAAFQPQGAYEQQQQQQQQQRPSAARKSSSLQAMPPPAVPTSTQKPGPVTGSVYSDARQQVFLT